MKITKLDTGVTAIEMDPSKEYMFIVDDDCGLEDGDIKFEHGCIIVKRAGSEIQIIEK